MMPPKPSKPTGPRKPPSPFLERDNIISKHQLTINAARMALDDYDRWVQEADTLNRYEDAIPEPPKVSAMRHLDNAAGRFRAAMAKLIQENP